MPFKRVTCPETAHLETIELEAHPLGTLIAGCSRDRPGCPLACSRRCAELLDRRERATGELAGVKLSSLEVGDATRFDLDLDELFAARRDS